jgi:hypothetical protein
MSAPATANTPTTPMTRDAPAFDFYPERWLVGVAGMSDAEQLSYLRLLCHQWLLGDAGLPADAPALKRLAGKGVTEAVLAKVPLHADGRRRNARLEIIRGEQRERISKAAEKGRKMAAGRWAGKQYAGNADGHGKGDAQASAKHAPSMAHALRDECPPPTADHPPPTPFSSEPVPAAGAHVRARPSLEEARGRAMQMGITPDEAEQWWLAREASAWLRSSNGALMPVGENWQADAKTFVNNTLERRRLGGLRAAQPPVRSDTANAPGRYA